MADDEGMMTDAAEQTIRYCPECGYELSEKSNFCPRCGHMLGTEAAAQTVPPETRPVKKPIITKTLAVLIVIAIVAVAAFSAVGNNSDSGKLSGKTFSEQCTTNVLDTEDGLNGTPVSGFTDGDTVIATLCLVDNDKKEDKYLCEQCYRINLSDSVTEKYGWYKWDVSESGTAIGSLSKAEGCITLYSNGFGCYHFSVGCSQSEGSAVEATYEFDIRIDPYLECTWTYDGGSFYFDRVIPNEDYYAQLPETASDRAVTDWSTAPDYIVVESNIKGIEDMLRSLYKQAYGSVQTDQSYADFILGFVQVCIPYYTDTQMYGCDEYYACPLQTLVNGGGDCEDTSILCAALYIAAGYSAGVMILPQHATVCVSISDYKAPNIGSSGEILKQTVGGLTYYSGETTLDQAQQVGIMTKYSENTYYSSFLNKGAAGYGSYGCYIKEA